MNKKHIITVVTVAVLVGAAGFFGGYKYAQSKTPADAVRFNGQNLTSQQRQALGQQFRGSRNGQNGGFASGQILAKDDKSITVQLPNNGGSKIIFYSGSTQINKPAAVDASQLAAGANVIVTGTANSDGSITAQNIQIRAANEPFPGQGQRPMQNQ